VKTKNFVALAAIFASAILRPTGFVHAASTIDATYRYAYGANLGWLDWRGDTTHGAVIGAYVCSGYPASLRSNATKSRFPQPVVSISRANRLRHGTGPATGHVTPPSRITKVGVLLEYAHAKPRQGHLGQSCEPHHDRRLK